MKKILIVLFAVLLCVPHYEKVYASTTSIPCPSGSGKCYYVNNPKSADITKRLVEPRMNPTTTANPKIGNVAGVVLQVFLSSPQGQKVLNESASKVDTFANALGTQIQNLSQVEGQAVMTAYDGLKTGGSALLNLGTTLYNSFMAKMDTAFKGADLSGFTANADGSYTFSDVFINTGTAPASFFSDKVLKRTIAGTGGATGVRKLYIVVYRSAFAQYYPYALNFNNGAYTGYTSYSGYTTEQQAVDSAFSLVVSGDQLNVYSPTKSNETIYNGSVGTIAMPKNLPSVNSVPAIVGDTAGNRYWEIPNNYTSDGVVNTDYVPVNNPDTVVKSTVVVNGDGYEVDTNTGEIIGDTPLVDAIPDDTVSSTDGAKESTLKGVLDGVLAIPETILDGITDLFVPSDADSITEPYTRIKEDIGAKFNSPSDFDFLKPNITEGECPPNIYVDMVGQHIKIVDLQIACSKSSWWKAIMTGFLWFLFGWWLFRKGNAIMARNGGVK